MIEYVADRYEDGALVCFTESGAAEGERSPDAGRLTFLCPAIPRSEGRRVLLFEAIGAAAYVRVSGAIPTPDGKAALILPPDRAREAVVRSRFEKIFKNRA